MLLGKKKETRNLTISNEYLDSKGANFRDYFVSYTGTLISYSEYKTDVCHIVTFHMQVNNNIILIPSQAC